MDRLSNPGDEVPASAIVWVIKWAGWIPLALIAFVIWQERKRPKNEE